MKNIEEIIADLRLVSAGIVRLTEFETRLDELDHEVELAGAPGVWNKNAVNFGLANGLLKARGIMGGNGAVYFSKPAQFLDDAQAQGEIPIPTPTPNPSPSAQGPFGVENFMIQNMKLVGDVYESLPGWQKDIAAIGIGVPGINYGKTMTLRFQRAANYDNKKRNIKILRGFTSRARLGIDKGACNIYVGKTPGEWRTTNTEGITVAASKQTTHWTDHKPEFRTEVWEVKFPSLVGRADGSIRRWVDGTLDVDQRSWQFDSMERPGLQTFWFIQDDYSPNSGDAGAPPADAWTKIRPISLEVK